MLKAIVHGVHTFSHNCMCCDPVRLWRVEGFRKLTRLTFRFNGGNGLTHMTAPNYNCYLEIQQSKVHQIVLVTAIRQKKKMYVSDFPDRLTFFSPTDSDLCDSKFFIGDHIENKWSKSDHFERSYEVLKTKFSKISANIDTYLKRNLTLGQ